jgi:hypothetical protein
MVDTLLKDKAILLARRIKALHILDKPFRTVEKYSAKIQFFILEDTPFNRQPERVLSITAAYDARVMFEFDFGQSRFLLLKDKYVNVINVNDAGPQLTAIISRTMGISIDPNSGAFVDQKDEVFFLLSYQKYLDNPTEIVYNIT